MIFLVKVSAIKNPNNSLNQIAGFLPTNFFIFILLWMTKYYEVMNSVSSIKLKIEFIAISKEKQIINRGMYIT